MKLSRNSLRDMVKDILNEEKEAPVLPFPHAIQEDEPTVEEAEDALEEDQDIIRFFENQDEDGEGKEVLDEHELSLADVVQEEIANFIESKKKNNSCSQALVLEFECKKLTAAMTESRENFLTECDTLEEGVDVLQEGAMAEMGHLGLDLIGLVPGVGSMADGLNAAWYAKEGRPTMAAMSALAAVPGVGMAAGAGKIGKSLSTLFRSMKLGKKVAQQAAGAGKLAKGMAGVKGLGKGLGKGMKQLKRLKANLAKRTAEVNKATAALKVAEKEAAALGKTIGPQNKLRRELATATQRFNKANKASAKFSGATSQVGKLEKGLADFAPTSVMGKKLKKAGQGTHDAVSDLQKLLKLNKMTGSTKVMVKLFGRQLDDPDTMLGQNRDKIMGTAAMMAGGPAAVAANPASLNALTQFGQFMQNRGEGNVPIPPERVADAGRDALASVLSGLPPERQRAIYDAYFGMTGADHELVEGKKRKKRKKMSRKESLKAILDDDPVKVMGTLVPLIKNLGWSGIAQKLMNTFMGSVFGKKKK